MLILISEFFIMTYVAVCNWVIRKYDSESHNIELKGKSWFLIAIISMLISVFLNKGSTYDLDYVISIYLMAYLLFQSITDLKIKKVYCLFNYIAILVMSIRVIALYLKGIDEYILHVSLMSFALFVIVLVVGKIFNLYGSGDGEVFLVIGLSQVFNTAIGDGLAPIYIMIVSCIISITSRIVTKVVKGKGYDIRQGRAFVPSIFIATFIVIFYSSNIA